MLSWNCHKLSHLSFPTNLWGEGHTFLGKDIVAPIAPILLSKRTMWSISATKAWSTQQSAKDLEFLRRILWDGARKASLSGKCGGRATRRWSRPWWSGLGRRENIRKSSSMKFKRKLGKWPQIHISKQAEDGLKISLPGLTNLLWKLNQLSDAWIKNESAIKIWSIGL